MGVFRLPKTGSLSRADDIIHPGGRPGTSTGSSSDSSGTGWGHLGDDLNGPPSSGNNDNINRDTELPDVSDDSSGSVATTPAVGSPKVTRTSPFIDSGSQTTVNSATSPTADSASASSTSGAMLPVWATVLIIVGAIMVFVFIISLAVLCVRERQKRFERGKDTSYGRAARRALAVATGAFIPIWIAKRLCGGGGSSRKSKRTAAQRDEGYAKIEGFLTYEHSQSSLSYVSPVPVPMPIPMPMAAPAPMHTAAAPVQFSSSPPPSSRRPLSVVSALSSDSGRGRYERVDSGGDAPHPGAGLQRNPSLVSALSSVDGQRVYSTADIPPPTPLSEHTATFYTTSERPPDYRASDRVGTRNSVSYRPYRP